jgi:hypothetical protein
MPNLKLTQAAVERLRPPASGRIEAWDSQLPGFGLRVSASGLKTWQAFYRVKGKMVREKLGTLAQIPNVGAARELARQSMTKARSGAHPVEDRRKHEDEERRQAEAGRSARGTRSPRRSIVILLSAPATRAGARCVPNISLTLPGPSKRM